MSSDLSVNLQTPSSTTGMNDTLSVTMNHEIKGDTAYQPVSMAENIPSMKKFSTMEEMDLIQLPSLDTKNSIFYAIEEDIGRSLKSPIRTSILELFGRTSVNDLVDPDK